MREHTALIALAMALAASVGCGPSAAPLIASDGSNTEPEIRLPPRDATTFQCGDIPEDGECSEGDVAVYCDRRSSSVVEKRCGARNLSCQMSEGGAICADGEGNEGNVPADQPTSGDPCGDITREGVCVDNVLMFCSTFETLVVEDCAEIDSTCGPLSSTSTFNYCNPNNCPEELRYADGCDDNNLLSCVYDYENNTHSVVSTDCSASNLSCTVYPLGNGACIDPEPELPTCAEVMDVGACIGDLAVWCASEEEGVQVTDCALEGFFCDWDDFLEMYTCI